MIIHGIVTDSSGRPVAGAVVAMTAAPAPVPDIAAVTDATGRFTLTAAGAGDHLLVVRSGGASVAVEVAVDGDTEVTVELADRRA